MTEILTRDATSEELDTYGRAVRTAMLLHLISEHCDYFDDNEYLRRVLRTRTGFTDTQIDRFSDQAIDMFRTAKMSDLQHEDMSRRQNIAIVIALAISAFAALALSLDWSGL